MKHNYILGFQLTFMLLVTSTGFAQNVMGIYPPQNAINIPTDANLMAGFDMLITPTMFNNATIVVTSAQTGVVSGTFSGINTNIITFNPTENFQPGELITIAISNPVGRKVVTFTTAVSPDSPGEFTNGQNIISSNADGAFSVFSADLDGDGDLDVVSASYNDNKIAWYENDGTGTFGTEQVLTTALDVAYAVLAADMDGDGDMDIVSGSAGDDKIAWYENDGAGNFGAEQLITTLANLTRKIFVADMDGDGDLDVLSNIANILKIRWYENSNAGTTWTERQVELSTLPTYASHMSATDLDNDGDMDIILYTNGSVVWYENDGSGTVSAQQLIGAMDDVRSLHTVDINGDGFQDVLIGTTNNGIYRHINNGDSSFGTAESMTAPINIAYHLNAADMDGDGDMDMLVAGYLANSLLWFENDGSGNFGSQQIITTAVQKPTHIHVADLDGDGDMDVLSTSTNDNKVAWYENADSTLSMPDNTLYEAIVVYPNPTSNQITLQNQNNLSLQKLQIYDLTGRLVKTIDLYNTLSAMTIDVSELEAATYVLNIITANYSMTKQLIIK